MGAGGATTRPLLFCMSRECLVWQFSRISSAWGTKSPRAFTFDVNKFYPKTQLSWLARLEHSHCNSADPLTDGLEVHLCEALFRCRLQPRETPPRRSSGRSTAHSSQVVRALQPRRTRYPRGIQPPARRCRAGSSRSRLVLGTRIDAGVILYGYGLVKPAVSVEVPKRF